MFYICIQRVIYLIFQDIPGYTPGADDYEFFNSPWLSLVKTSTMFVGEIEFSDIPIGQENVLFFFMLIFFFLSLATLYMIPFQPFVCLQYNTHIQHIFNIKTKKRIFDDFDSLNDNLEK